MARKDSCAGTTLGTLVDDIRAQCRATSNGVTVRRMLGSPPEVLSRESLVAYEFNKLHGLRLLFVVVGHGGA